jgi:hypothetical protein
MIRKPQLDQQEQLFELALCPVCHVQLNFLSGAEDLQLPFKAGIAKAMMTEKSKDSKQSIKTH